MRKLYEINKDIERVLDEAFTMKLNEETAVDTESGEVFNIADKLEALNAEKNDKIKSVAVYADDIAAKLAAVKAKIAALEKSKKTLDNELAGLTEYLLIATENKGYKDDEIEVKCKVTKRCEFTDETLIPDEYKKTKTEITISKTEITKAIKNGETVPGAELRDHYSITII